MITKAVFQTNAHILPKWGSPYLYDLRTEQEISLPAGIHLLHSHQDAWVGGSSDGRYFFYVKRYPMSAGTLPQELEEPEIHQRTVVAGDSDVLTPWAYPIEAMLHQSLTKGHMGIVESKHSRYLVLALCQLSEPNYASKQILVDFAKAV